MGNFYAMPRYIMRRTCIETILKQLPCTNKNLLEIGYGAADIFKIYLKYKINIYGYDFSEYAYKTVQGNLNHDTATLYKDESEILLGFYDYVVACEVLEHIEDDNAAISKWVSYLKDEGKLLISVPAHMKYWGPNDIISGHFRRYERQHFIDLCKKNNLKVDNLYCYDFPMGLLLNPLRDKRVEKRLKEKQDTTKEELTKISGLDRDTNVFIQALSNKYIWICIAKFQKIFYKYDLGSCYLIECTKIGSR